MFAHCLPQDDGGVGLAILNLGDEEHAIAFGTGAEVYSLTASDLASEELLINQSRPSMQDNGTIDGLVPVTRNGAELAPHSVTFVAVNGADNPNCSAGSVQGESSERINRPQSRTAPSEAGN